MKSIRLLGAALLASTTLLGAGQAFADVSTPSTPTPAEKRTPISAELTVNTTPDKPVPPTEPGEGGGDGVTEITGLFGIAYTPKALSGQGELAEDGPSTIDLSNNESTQGKYNVGVQDKTRGNDRNWSLKAQLEWTGDNSDYMTGATITATEGNVKLNTDGVLSEVANGEVTIGDTATSLTIEQGSQVELMKANAGKTVNGVYNYQFKAPKLVIPNSANVAAGTYSGNIVWNLSNVTE